MGLNNYTWRDIDKLEWASHWSDVFQSNLMQSWEYGDAKALSEGWSPVRYIFEDSKGRPTALVQILTKSFYIFGEIARLNRGPLLLVSNPNFSDETFIKLDIIRVLKKIAKEKRWLVFFMAPELSELDFPNETLRLNHLNIRKNIFPWASARLCLDVDESSLMAGLKGRWRGALKKAYKNDVNVINMELSSEAIDELDLFYKNAQKEIGFSGISPSLLKCLCTASGSNWKVCYYVVKDKAQNELCGILVSIVHGDTATYLIGNTNTEGRRIQANYAMLWQAIIDAKSLGCGWYDLGGLNKNTPKGIASFKSGLNGENYQLVGETRTLPIFSK